MRMTNIHFSVGTIPDESFDVKLNEECRNEVLQSKVHVPWYSALFLHSGYARALRLVNRPHGPGARRITPSGGRRR